MADRANKLVLTFDLAATLVFATEGGLAAVDAHLDVLGVMVIAFATALAGGITRDLLIGAVPPAAVHYRRYAVAALGAGALAFCSHVVIDDVPTGVLTALDAAGLGLFAVSGAEKSLLYGINPLMSTLLGAVTAVGGGTVRDLLLNRVPAVLYADVYAAAALFGSAVMVVGARRGAPRGPLMLLGAGCCFTLRMIAHWQGWNLPTAS